ncbi:MAG: 50S ribosomal protein L6 [Omnitrophica bacterium RIFCSPHIGHO2_02_FULL_51_18]|nr:MAG: 50S ribosomal protein L6 [Omnitrophica bacterium RIFCSPHIGHO2_02_FULL_51_18]
MSRIGKKPIEIPSGVKVAVDHQTVNVEGPKGKLQFRLHPRVKAVMKESVLTVSPVSEMKTDRALQGTSRSVIHNMILGVTNGYVKELSIEGVGFKATVQGKQLQLLLGFTHPVIFDMPEGVTVEAPKPTQVFIKGIDKVKVGQFAAKVRKAFEAEPYKGKGIKYAGEVIRRKAGKTVTK